MATPYARRRCRWMTSSMSKPPIRSDLLAMIPPIDTMATSDVPPPTSTMRLPRGSWTGRPAPIAAAMGSSMSDTARAPADVAASRTARRSTSVMAEGTDGHDPGRGSPDHLPGLLADGQDVALPGVHGDDRGLVVDDALALLVDERVGRPQVDGEVADAFHAGVRYRRGSRTAAADQGRPGRRGGPIPPGGGG